VLDMFHPLLWVVHPLGGIILAFLSTVIFSQRRRHWLPVLAGVAVLLLLTVSGAGWLVHPAAGLALALLASVLFRSWQKYRPTIVLTVVALITFISLGAEWAIFPMVGFGMLWMLKMVFTGELLRVPQELKTAQAFAGGTADLGGGTDRPAALPGQGRGEAMLKVASQFTQSVPDRVAARAQRRMQRRVDKLERRAERLGVPFRMQTVTAPAQPVAVNPTEAGGGLLALARDERLPADARARLGALHHRCAEALAYLRDHDQDSAGAGPGFMVRQIVEDYAPEAARAYLKLPPSRADVTPLQDGKTGRDLLGEQLDLLLAAVQDIMAQATQASSQRLLAHQRFLKDRFAKADDELKL
jgi:hypothetical protein